jgi:hypothetical protein
MPSVVQTLREGDGMTNQVAGPRASAVAAGAVVGAFALLGVQAGVPKLWSPRPAAIVIPLLWSDRFLDGLYANHPALGYVVPVLIGATYFAGWNIHLFRGHSEVPRRSVVALTVLTLLTVADFTFGWRYGTEYQGMQYTLAVVTINAVALAVCWIAYCRALRRPSFGRSLAFHSLTAVWLVWLAFPWLGELI